MVRGLFLYVPSPTPITDDQHIAFGYETSAIESACNESIPACKIALRIGAQISPERDIYAIEYAIRKAIFGLKKHSEDSPTYCIAF